MTLGRRPWLPLFALALACGCNGSRTGSLLGPSASTKSLKSSLSHLEYENRQLKSKVAKLDAENREIDNRLVQEEAANGDLRARLDDARTVMNEKGHSAAAGLDSAQGKMLPAGQSNRKGRKPPFAQIPGRIDTVPSDDDGYPAKTPTLPPDDFGPQSSTGPGLQWSPIADGTQPPAKPRR